MKANKRIVALCLVISVFQLQAQVRNEIKVPDLKGYQTLKCDFHSHTVFSDGLVWPTVRIDEVYREGLDAISLTEHIEYRPHKADIQASHGRSYEIAVKTAEEKDILLIRGSEITRSMPPGHFNAIFLTNCDALEQKEWRNAFKEAKAQNAFIFWNHPGWDNQQPDTTLWWKEHTEILNNGWMHGIEVANGRMYSSEAHQWCLDKNLTMIGTSDIHQPIQTDINFAKGKHRSMTFVFAKEKTLEGIREALDNRRTAVYYDDLVIGEDQYLREMFENAIEIIEVKRNEKSLTVVLKNKSDLRFELKKTAHDANVVYFRDYTIQPQSQHSITIKLPAQLKSGEVNFVVKNLLTAPGESMAYSYAF